MQKMALQKEQETLFIPLYGKALMSRAGELIRDEKAERIVDLVDYDFSKTRMPKGLQIYMAIRACILDEYARGFLGKNPDSVVVHLGCGLDSRCERAGKAASLWHDLDFPAVIEVRKRFYQENEHYQMIASDATDHVWMDQVEANGGPVLVIAEGMTMYLSEQQIRDLVLALRDRFPGCELAFDAYSVWSVKASKRHNPVNKMGAVIRWGLDDPALIEAYAPSIQCLGTRFFTDYPGIKTLPPSNRILFRLLYQNPMVKKMYRIFAFKLDKA